MADGLRLCRYSKINAGDFLTARKRKEAHYGEGTQVWRLDAGRSMKKNALVEFSIARPKLVLAVVLLLTPLFFVQLPKIKLDTNPKNMLPPSSAVRVWNDSVDLNFGLYEDTMVVGIVHTEEPLIK